MSPARDFDTIRLVNPPSGRAGRPPGPHDDTLAKLMPAALRLFLEEGGAALTPTRLHQETGVARATIYRNWPEPADLIELMLARATTAPPEDNLTGDLEADLRAAMDVLRLRFERRPVRPFFAACLEYGRTSDRVATAAELFIAGILNPFRTAMTAGVERGQIDGDPEELVLELAGPVVLEHVMLGRRVGRARARAVVDQFLDHHRRRAEERAT